MPNDNKNKPGPNDMVFYVGDELLPEGTHYLWKLWKLVNKRDAVSQNGVGVVAKKMDMIPLMIVDKLMQERCYDAVQKAASVLATAAIAYMMPSVNVEDAAKVFKCKPDGELGERINLQSKAKPSEPSAN